MSQSGWPSYDRALQCSRPSSARCSLRRRLALDVLGARWLWRPHPFILLPSPPESLPKERRQPKFSPYNLLHSVCFLMRRRGFLCWAVPERWASPPFLFGLRRPPTYYEAFMASRSRHLASSIAYASSARRLVRSRQYNSRGAQALAARYLYPRPHIAIVVRTGLGLSPLRRSSISRHLFRRSSFN